MGAYKNVLQSLHLVSDGSLAGDLTSSAVNIAFLDNIGLQFIWTGTPTGTFGVQVSIDGVWNGTVWTGTNWTTYTLGSAPAPSGSPSSAYVDLNQVSAPALRVTYTRSGGSGTAQVWVSGKSL